MDKKRTPPHIDGDGCAECGRSLAGRPVEVDLTCGAVIHASNGCTAHHHGCDFLGDNGEGLRFK